MRHYIQRYRLVLLSMVMVATLAVISGSLAATGPVAHAATSSTVPTWAGPGPSAAADEFNDQYVFWRGTDNQLYEGWYDQYTNHWSGPIDLHMGSLGSEPSVAISYTQVFAGPGGHPYNAQYVYWQGSDHASLWMAYWHGGWHGPVQIAPNAIQALPCSQPSADVINPAAGQQIDLYWWGVNVSGCNSYLFTANTTSANPIYASDYFGPIQAAEAGSIASTPSVGSTYAPDPATNAQCLCAEMVAWVGHDGRLWSSNWVNGGGWSNAIPDSVGGQLGSPPNVSDAIYFSQVIYQLAWRGQDGRLWLSNFDATTSHYSTPSPLNAAGVLGSAPSWAPSAAPNGNAYIFWKGTDANLWEAYWNASNGNWQIINLHMGPLG